MSALKHAPKPRKEKKSGPRFLHIDTDTNNTGNDHFELFLLNVILQDIESWGALSFSQCSIESCENCDYFGEKLWDVQWIFMIFPLCKNAKG